MNLVAMLWLFQAALQDPNIVFKSEVRLVEVHATVWDQRGKYVDALTKDRFEIRDNDAPQPIAVFETDTAGISCAILIDTTGSMAHALPAVKNAVVKLIDELRAEDSVAVYGFSASLQTLQDFTQDKAAAKRAALRTRAAGETALFDSLSQLARKLARRNGKKAIIAFTDGEDNQSILNAGAAIARVKKSGIPVYAVAQGGALKSRTLLHELDEIARQTGGHCYKAARTSDIAAVFEDISNDLKHTYLLAYRPPPASGEHWRTIQLSVKGLKDHKVRAKQGYVPE